MIVVSRVMTVLAVLVVAAGLSPPVQAQSTVRCESQSQQTNHCDVDTRGGVRLTRQLSHAGCWQNDTWGYDRRGIWVSNGCRAEFALGGSGWQNDYDRHDRDDRGSDNTGKVVAGAVVLGLIGAAILADKHDDDRRDDGYGGTVTCESDNGRYRHCPVNLGRGHVEIERVLSRGECRYGQSWGTDRRGIWVDRGCRARFAIR